MKARVAAVTMAVLVTACHGSKSNQAPTPVAAAPTATDTSLSLASLPLDSGKPDSVHVAQGDLTHEAVKIFGDSLATAPPATAEPTWDIDVRSFETHDRVVYFVGRFTGPSSDRFVEELARGGRYEPIIRRKLHAAGMPEDMTYLALIESGYNPHAYSSAAAVGLWQFMASTARGTGLRVDWWIDERRDPVRSTDGAIKFLGWLKDEFGSYYLAAAAYNGGAGRVSRGLKRYADEVEGESGDSAFFSMAAAGNYLRAETRDYVPKLIAAALVAKEPEKYGLKVHYLPEFEYDTVQVGSATPLAAVAKAAGASIADIQDLNPEILRGVTPPDQRFTIRVPKGHADGFDGAYAQLSSTDRAAFTHARVKKGETIASIARRTGVSARTLGWYNRSLKPMKHGRLLAGEAVLLPTSAVVAGALDIPDPSVEKWGSSRRGAHVTHVVTKGETLGRIAVRYGTTVTGLMRMNGMSGSRLIPGQVLIVKTGSRSHRKKRAHKRGE
ncbi:MAG: transglycosylase SLT domain-containing protein [Gemmatimonadaceae bacterium]|nr:transglycosylase SLT domain-containing protein [Gemmatimonadaceae bacterium]